MIINPIYFNLGSDSSGHGENDWDPTDVKENKEMLDLSNYNPCQLKIETSRIENLDDSIFIANNTTLIMLLQFSNTGSYSIQAMKWSGSHGNYVLGTKIIFAASSTAELYVYKIKLPKSYDGCNVYFNNGNYVKSSSIWYKND